jgi:hypothetical protein
MPPIFKKDDRFKQGIFKPMNPQKFMGEYAIFRSSYERRFFLWADKNPNVLEWGSEQIIVPYKSPMDNRIHRYYIDIYMVLKEGDQIKKYLIEIKPFSQTQPPKPSKKKKKETVLYENVQWQINSAKWESAKKFAQSKGAEFIILTENELP